MSICSAEIIEFVRPEGNRKNLFITNIPYCSEEDLHDFLFPLFSQYGLIHGINVYQYTSTQDKVPGCYAFVTFYSVIAAHIAKESLSNKIVYKETECKIAYAKRKKESQAVSNLHFSKCQELANFYLGFNGWSSTVKLYADVKKDLRVQIRDMRRTIQEMLKQNETLPDIEKLGRHEFDLDIEEQNRLQTEADAEVQRVREEIEFDNLAKIYLREMIKKECWDDMKVKGRAVQAFFSTLEVSNFPMRERQKDFERLLETVTKRRKIELAELAARKTEVEVTNRPTTTADKEKPNQQPVARAKKDSSDENLGQVKDRFHTLTLTFKREFNDVTALQQDQLYRLFRRRPKIPRLKGFDTPAAPSTADHGLPNPFADRPSTARQHAQAKSQLEAAINDLDKPVNNPEGIDLPVWERLCKFRRIKIENDFLIKQKALVFAEMEAFYRKRQDEDEQLKIDIEDIQMLISKLKNDQARFNLNLEVQLLLKQGQVEIDPTNFIANYRDSALIHRSVVEELNTNIKKLGEDKISSMVESKDFRKGIIQLEWEHKKMLMLMEDLQNKMKDIQFMKVTREIQLFLNNEDYDGKKADEINKLEQTIVTQLKHHEKKLAEKKKILKELGRTIKSKDSDNANIDSDLTELNVTVNERKLIDEVNADRRSDVGKDKRYFEIVQRRRLVDLAKAQAQEVAVLRAEVERLRMRTFPALVQVEH